MHTTFSLVPCCWWSVTFITFLAGSTKASGSSDDDAGVFADIVSAEALCLDILEGQSSDANLSHNPFTDYKSISIPTPGMYVQGFFLSTKYKESYPMSKSCTLDMPAWFVYNWFPNFHDVFHFLTCIETVSSSSLSADGSSIDRVNIEQSDEEDETTVLSMSNFNVSHFGHV